MAISDEQIHVASPCTQVCVMDSENSYCQGCFRTLQEISRWGTASNEEKRSILATLQERKGVIGDE